MGGRGRRVAALVGLLLVRVTPCMRKGGGEGGGEIVGEPVVTRGQNTCTCMEDVSVTLFNNLQICIIHHMALIRISLSGKSPRLTAFFRSG